MHNGVHIVFEGSDYSGKSTLANLVLEDLHAHTHPDAFNCILLHNPGSTPLGMHIRKLVKTPEVFNEPDKDPIVIDPLSAQMLMMVDYNCSVNTKLIPHLNKNGIVLSDRSNHISGMVYGVAEGVKLTALNKLINLVQSPQPDRVFIISNKWETIVERIKNSKDRIKTDRFDSNIDLLRRINDIYDNLLTLNQEALMLLAHYVPLERITYINGETPAMEVAKSISKQILRLASEKLSSSFQF